MSNVILVTGASSGIGAAIAVALAARGATPMLVARRAPELAEVLARCGRGSAVVADIATPEGRARVCEAVPDHLAGLVHGAGWMPVARASDLTDDTWESVLATNVGARASLTRALLPRLGPAARILFIGSFSADTPRAGASAYCTTMAASQMLMRCLRLELAPDVGVAQLIPGAVRTALVMGAVTADPEQFPDAAWFAEQASSGAMAEPEEVGEFAAQLLLEMSFDAFSGAASHLLPRLETP